MRRGSYRRQSRGGAPARARAPRSEPSPDPVGSSRSGAIAVGREVAKVLVGEHSSLLYPFRFDRFETGDLHPVSHSPYPWS